MPVWDAEISIDDVLVRGLLAEQFPTLDASSARLLGEGWDNAAWVVEEVWVFRFPRRAVAVPLIEREVVVLPQLAPMLPVPVPEPVFIGRPSISYPWPFFGSCLHAPGVAGAMDPDWGDTCVGDPAIDLHVAWSLLPSAARGRFVDIYGPVDDERLLRARILAMSLAAMLALYAHDVGHTTLESESLAGLDRALLE